MPISNILVRNLPQPYMTINNILCVVIYLCFTSICLSTTFYVRDLPQSYTTINQVLFVS